MRFTDTLTTIVRQILESGSVPALIGEVAIGKSSFVEDLARQMGTTAFVLPMNQLAAKEDFTGARLIPHTAPDGSQDYKQAFYPHEIIRDAVDYALDNPREKPVLFLDEINRTSSDVTSAGLTLVTLRRMGRIQLPDNLRLIVAGNDRGNITALDEASVSRFVLLHVEPDAQTFMELHHDDLNPWIRTTLTKNPSLIFQKATPAAIVADSQDEDGNVTFAETWDAGEEMMQLTAPRTIMALSRWLNIAERQQLAQHLATSVQVSGRDTSELNEIIEGFTGDTMFTAQLVATIADDLAQGDGSQTPRLTVARPDCYTDLKSATTRHALETMSSALTTREISASLIFALHEREDNTGLIDLLARQATQIEPEHTRTLIEMVTTGQIDRSNLEVFLDVDAPIVETVRPILSAFL